MDNKKDKIGTKKGNENKKRLELKSDEELVKETDDMFMKPDSLTKKSSKK